ncbi:MAG: haloacid dehalogenase-like hydrolase, partial [Steroidobacteraceae bacterium]
DHVAVLSASPDIFVPEIAQAIGAHEVICSEVRWRGDRLDGRLAGPNRRDHEKARVLAQLRARLPGLPVIAYGNSAADLTHMFECEQAVYVNPGATLAGQLEARGLRIVRWQ